jgi:hypothetical protein
MEPYWSEVRISQVIGRGIRQCSHEDLPLSDRNLDVYRYKVTKPYVRNNDDNEPLTADFHVENLAKAKDSLIQSFLMAIKESAVDCELFKNNNMITTKYQCFKFPEKMLFNDVGPAYVDDIKEDQKYSSGLYATNAKVERIRVIKINAVRVTNKDTTNPTYSLPEPYWYYSQNGMVYDVSLFYPVGRVVTVNNLPNKLNKDTYIISEFIHIP